MSTGLVQWLAIMAIGAGVGFLGGMFGKGGSAIATPLLAAVGVPPLVAVASPLPAAVPGTLVAYRRSRSTFRKFEINATVLSLDLSISRLATCMARITFFNSSARLRSVAIITVRPPKGIRA